MDKHDSWGVPFILFLVVKFRVNLAKDIVNNLPKTKGRRDNIGNIVSDFEVLI